MNQEITLELLGDVATAVKAVLRQVVPSMPVKVRIVTEPHLGIFIQVADSADPVYGHIIKARADKLSLTNDGRRLLGLPEREGR